MNAKRLLLALLLICSVNAFCQQAKTVTLQNQPPKVTSSTEQSFNDEIKQLQLEIAALKNRIQEISDANIVNQNRIKFYSDKTDTDISHWFSLLAILITFVSIACPLIINLSYKSQFDSQLKKLKNDLDSIIDSVESARKDAESAKESVSTITKLKQDIDNIKKDIDKSKKTTERAAKRAMANKMFTQALSETDKLKAIEYYTKAIELNPKYSDAYNNRGILKQELGDKEGAMQDYNKAIELNPNDSELYYNRGILKKEQDDIDMEGAMQDYDKAIALNPNYANAYNGRGYLYLQVKDWPKAKADFDKAIELSPNDPNYLDSRADLFVAMEDYENAMKDIEKGLSLNPSEEVEKALMDKKALCEKKLEERKA